MITDNGQMADSFLNKSSHFDGPMTGILRPMGDNTRARKIAENSIKATAVNGTSGNLETIVTGILTSNAAYLKDYVTAHGEMPFRNPVKLSVQAVLLRAKDVAAQAIALDATDETALRNIEEAESGAQDINSPDEATVLPTNVQGALKVAMDYLSDCHIGIGGDGTMRSAISDASKSAAAAGQSNSFIGDNPDDSTDPTDNTPIYSTPITVGLADTGGATVNASGEIVAPTITAGPAPSTNTSGIINNSGGAAGVLGTLQGIIGSIGTLAGGITQSANSVAQAGGAVKNAVSNVGANSISAWISQNPGTLIMFALAIAVILFVVIYAVKKAK